jgi:hypothetical protein
VELKLREALTPLVTFLVHTFVGTAIFVVICVPVVGLHVLVKWLETFNLPDVIVWALKAAEYLLFGVDWILFVWFVIRTGVKVIRES